MTIYALVLDDAEVTRMAFDAPPPAIAENKGVWYPLGPTDPQPDPTQFVVTGTSGNITEGAWCPSWETRPLTAAEMAAGLAQAQAAQIGALRSNCDTEIVQGFTSSALGSAYTYPSAGTDQANLQQTAMAASGGLLMCEDSKGDWVLVAHTQAQGQQVLADFVAFRDKQRQALATLTGDVNSAGAVAAVQAVVWSS